MNKPAALLIWISATCLTPFLMMGCITRSATPPSAQATPRLTVSEDTDFPEIADWQRARDDVESRVNRLLDEFRRTGADTARSLTVTRGTTAHKLIALTFDDGPNPYYTEALLKVLARFHAKGTFFVTGKMARRYPELVRAIAAAGHGLANHTYNHVNLTTIPQLDMAMEIQACEDVLRDVTGHAPRYFRPPGGNYDSCVSEVLAAMGYINVLWTINTHDYKKPPREQVEASVITRAKPGDIVLLHSGAQVTIDALPAIITTLQQQGYKLVTIAEILHPGQPAQSNSPHPSAPAAPAGHGPQPL